MCSRLTLRCIFKRNNWGNLACTSCALKVVFCVTAALIVEKLARRCIRISKNALFPRGSGARCQSPRRSQKVCAGAWSCDSRGALNIAAQCKNETKKRHSKISSFAAHCMLLAVQECLKGGEIYFETIDSGLSIRMSAVRKELMSLLKNFLSHAF